MNINIISVGKIKEAYLIDAINEYEKRISKYAKIHNIELKDEPIKNNMSDEQIKTIEGLRIQEALPTGYNILLDLRGKEYTSIEFSKKIDEVFLYNSSSINFIIGGSLGVSEDVVKKSDLLVSFSKMTFPHQLMKVFLLEQIYRAFKILNNETYHK